MAPISPIRPGVTPPDESEAPEPYRNRYGCAGEEALIEQDSGLSARERGWVESEEEYLKRRRHRARRSLVTVEREVEIMRRYHRGVPVRDIADELDIAPSTVSTSVKRSLKRTLNHAGAQEEREKQLHQADAIMARLLEQIFPDPDPNTGITPAVDFKAAEVMLKYMARKAALTGADAPVKHEVKGEIHHVADEATSRVLQYIDLVDTMVANGYGSGVVPVDPARQRALEVKAVDLRPLDEQVSERPLALLPFSIEPSPDDE